MKKPAHPFQFLCLTTFLFLAGPVFPAPAGDSSSLEPGLKNRADILFFGGFEAQPWTSDWGIDWGPEPAANSTIVEGTSAFDGRSLRVKYSQGSFSGGACQFLTDFSKLSIQPQESLYLRYYLRFDPGFDFVKGGKLPGLAGGKGNTGGHKPNGQDGWSARIMWRPDGKIVQYVYYPDQPGTYGEDFDWNYGGCPRFFKPGKWYCVETFVQMNSPGKKDGVIRSWLDGDKALEITGLRFRDIPEIKIDKLEFETFFGGGDASWATPRDQYSMFDNAVIAKNYIGPDKDLATKTQAPDAPALSEKSETPGTLVFDGDHPAWATSSWSDGSYDFHSKAQNHTSGGGQSVYVALPNGAWGAIQFAGSPLKAGDNKSICFWVYPTGCDVEFRVRLESQGSQVGIEKVVTGARGWAVNEWNYVRLNLADFQVPDFFSRIVITSNSAKGVSPFYLDDLKLQK
ncbi:MAG TPA: hypothetical protein VJ873_08190 [bacterium]|nr:hypothetical protein [bacterium]